MHGNIFWNISERFTAISCKGVDEQANLKRNLNYCLILEVSVTGTCPDYVTFIYILDKCD